jgi:hypothetical protein
VSTHQSGQRADFPSPWVIDEHPPCFIVRDANRQARAYVYLEEEPGRRAAKRMAASFASGFRGYIFATIIARWPPGRSRGGDAEAEHRRVFAALAQDGGEGIVVDDETENLVNYRLIVELAEKNRLPAIYPFKMFVGAGGLMSYGIDVSALGHSIADIVGQILKGAKPSEIPIFQPTKFELAINLKTAKALGLSVPPELLTVADEVIE